MFCLGIVFLFVWLCVLCSEVKLGGGLGLCENCCTGPSHGQWTMVYPVVGPSGRMARL